MTQDFRGDKFVKKNLCSDLRKGKCMHKCMHKHMFNDTHFKRSVSQIRIQYALHKIVLRAIFLLVTALSSVFSWSEIHLGTKIRGGSFPIACGLGRSSVGIW